MRVSAFCANDHGPEYPIAARQTRAVVALPHVASTAHCHSGRRQGLRHARLYGELLLLDEPHQLLMREGEQREPTSEPLLAEPEEVLVASAGGHRRE